MSKLRIARSAVADLDEIWLYIARHASVEAAERVMNLLTSKFSLLAGSPGIGRRRPELGLEIRSFPVQNYRIYYRPEKRGVVRILYVRHAKREESRLFG
jgi:toxin ParE1/3/4